MARSVSIALTALLVAVPVFSSCRAVDDAPRDEGHAGEAAGAAPGAAAPQAVSSDAAGHVSLTGVAGVAVRPVGQPVEQGVWHPAEAMPDESGRAALAAPVGGIVTQVNTVPGREVPRGTPLLTIRSPELAQLSASWLACRAKSQQAASDLAREERLAQAGAGATRELEAARAAVAVAQAEEAGVAMELEAHGVAPGQAGATTVVRAPRRGRVAKYSVLSGQGVETGQELGIFEVGQGALVGLELAQPGAVAWQPGATASVRHGDGRTWTARVEGLPSSFSTSTRRLTYRLRLEGHDLPYPGTPVEVLVPLPRSIVVPQGALQQVNGTWGVFVVSGAEAAFRPVHQGPDLGDNVIVLEGLAPGERIVVDGAFLIKALLLKQSGEGGDND